MARYIRPYVYLIFLCASASAQVCQIPNGCTGASTASGARTNLGTAASGDNQDILSLDKVQQITMNPFATPATPTGTLSAGGSLVNGTSYYAVVTALGSNYSIVGGVCVNGCTVLSTASAAVTATSVNKTITWNWTATAGAVAYILWANTANTGFTRYVIVTTNSYVMTQFPTGFSTGTPPTVNTTGEIIAAKVPSLTVQQSAAAPNGAIDYEPLTGASSSCCITVNTNPFLQDANLGTGTELITLQDSPASTGQGMLFWSHSTSGLFQFLNGSGLFAEFDTAGNLDFAGNTILLNTLTGSIGSTTGLVQINDTANVFTNGDLVTFGSDGGTTDSGVLATSPPQKVLNCGTAAACSNTLQASPRLEWGGPIALVGGTKTITGMTAWTSTSTFACNCSDRTTAGNACNAVPASATSITLTGTGTDSVTYQCFGN